VAATDAFRPEKPRSPRASMAYENVDHGGMRKAPGTGHNTSSTPSEWISSVRETHLLALRAGIINGKVS